MPAHEEAPNLTTRPAVERGEGVTRTFVYLAVAAVAFQAVHVVANLARVGY